MQNLLDLTITEAAEAHFKSLIEQEGLANLNIRLQVKNPKTSRAEVDITFCPAGEELNNDFVIDLQGFKFYIAHGALSALADAKIDYKYDEEGLNGHLAISAPHLQGPKLSPDASLRERIEFVLEDEICPGLASHGGSVSLVSLLEEVQNQVVAVLKFSGGCQGCGMAAQTLKQGIEKTLKERFPEILEVRDTTDHKSGTNPYYA
ncbi:MAG: NifU family protein [Gammaproteobacteria bacterium]